MVAESIMIAVIFFLMMLLIIIMGYNTYQVLQIVEEALIYKMRTKVQIALLEAEVDRLTKKNARNKK